LHGKTIDLTSDVISINSNYFQVSPEGIVTCQALGVTGDNSYINLNDTFIVDSTGRVIIYDKSDSYSGYECFKIIDYQNQNNETTIAFDNFTMKSDRKESQFAAGYIYLDTAQTEYNFADIFSMHRSEGAHFQVSPTNAKDKFDVYVEGNVYADNISSDLNLKKNIEDSKINALAEIMQIKHRTFDWKSNNKHENNGYIAQELEKIDSNLIEKVSIEEEEKYYLNLKNLVALSTKAIQELAKEVEELKNGKTN